MFYDVLSWKLIYASNLILLNQSMSYPKKARKSKQKSKIWPVNIFFAWSMCTKFIFINIIELLDLSFRLIFLSSILDLPFKNLSIHRNRHESCEMISPLWKKTRRIDYREEKLSIGESQQGQVSVLKGLPIASKIPWKERAGLLR